MQTIDEVEQALERERKERGRALASGGKYDNSRIAKLHERMAELQDLEVAQAELAREEAAKAHAKAVNVARREVEDLMASSAKALSDSRNGYAAGCASMRTHLQLEASLRKKQGELLRLTGENVRVDSEFDLINKRSRQVAAVGLKPLSSVPGKFGVITYPGMTLIDWK